MGAELPGRMVVERAQQLYLAQAQADDGAPGRPWDRFFDITAICPMTPAQAWTWRRWATAGAPQWEA